MASIRFAARVKAAAASPSFLASAPGPSIIVANSDRRLSLVEEARGPSSQVIASAFRPCIADQVLSATTATPFETRTTCFTPGTPFAFASSKVTSFPPKTGHRSMTAYCIPGSRTSIPNVVLPSTLPGVSRRFGDVPIRRNWLGSLSFTDALAGAGRAAASEASEPKLARAFVAVFTTTPFSARQIDGLEPQRSAAAATSISRAVAPALRSGSQDDRMLELP